MCFAASSSLKAGSAAFSFYPFTELLFYPFMDLLFASGWLISGRAAIFLWLELLLGLSLCEAFAEKI